MNEPTPLQLWVAEQLNSPVPKVILRNVSTRASIHLNIIALGCSGIDCHKCSWDGLKSPKGNCLSLAKVYPQPTLNIM